MQSEPNTPQHPFKIDVAERVKRLPPYLFGKINDLKYRKRRAGVDVIDLGMGNPTDVPDQVVIDKMVEAVKDERNHRYSVSTGLFNLRREAALRYERRHGVQLNPETEVLAGLGSKEVFSHMCLALMGPGDTAIVPAPSFPIHIYAVALASANVISLDCTQPDRFLSSVSAVAEHLYPKPKVLILNFPHNPSTTVVERDFFVDVVKRQAAEYQGRRDVLVDGLERIGWETQKPKAGMFVWTRYPQEWRERMGSIDFAMKLLEEAEVAVSPGRGFGEAGEGYLRLALVENEQRLRQAVRQIGRCLRLEEAAG